MPYASQTTKAALVEALLPLVAAAGAPRAFFGFDGYVDTIKKVVQSRGSNGERRFFKTIAEFGILFSALAGKSADFEVVPFRRKIGGNAPIMAHAAAVLGVFAICVGAVGYPDIDAIFSEPTPRLRRFGIAHPAMTDAFEFDDGKLMFGENGSLKEISWELSQQRLAAKGIDLVTELSESQLIAVLNWASVGTIMEFLRGIQTHVRERSGTEAFAAKILFVDFADISSVDAATVRSWIAILENLQCRIALSLNFKEAQLLAAILKRAVDDEPEALCTTIGTALSLDLVIVHHRAGACALDAAGLHRADGFFVEKPLLSTGSGDNFNAGIAYGLLHDLPVADCLLLGNAVASLYVRSGISPSLSDVINALHIENSTVLSLEEY